MIDARRLVIKDRLLQLPRIGILRILFNIDTLICFDTFNYDKHTKKFCPIAIGLNLHKIISNPTDKIISNEIGKVFNPPNALKGLKGTFYTTNRKEDLIEICCEILDVKLNA